MGKTSMALRLAMLGTGTFALPTFRKLYESGHDVVGLVTQPDRIARGNRVHPNPMKEHALAHETPVLQPEKINAPESLAALREWNADLFVVAAYGQILSADVISAPRLGSINLHASLLPKYRGAAPIQYAMWKGETETGVTIFQIEPKLDAGPIHGVVSTEIDSHETYGELQDRLAELSVPLTLKVVEQLANGSVDGIVQDSSGVTKAPRIKKTDGEINWSQTSREIDCHIRAMQPWPKPYSFLRTDIGTSRLLILKVAATSVSGGDVEPGTVVVVDSERITVRTGDGCLEIATIQPEGKRAMATAEFLRGRPVQVGQRFEAEI